jgi:7-cyano-7-deazaguanine synthase
MTQAVVLLSGGLDSTVTLAYALEQGHEVTPLTVCYGQKHSREIKAAKDVVKFYKIKRHLLVNLDLSFLKTSALTSPHVQVPERRSLEEIGSDIPSTYVPARNIIMLSIAAGLAETEGAKRIFIGANAVDYSGYPDCRPEFFKAFQKVLDVGTKTGTEGSPVKIEHPLLFLTKGEIVNLGRKLRAPLHLTWSCYRGGETACGTCDSCLLRLKGFREAGIKDEIPYEVRR